VTVVPLATPGHKIRSAVIVIAAAITDDKEFFIAFIPQRERSNNPPSHTMLER
jgi:hypothetical protein